MLLTKFIHYLKIVVVLPQCMSLSIRVRNPRRVLFVLKEENKQTKELKMITSRNLKDLEF